MLKNLTIIATVAALLLLSGAQLVLAQQDGDTSGDIGLSEEFIASSDLYVEEIDPDGSGTAGSGGSVQYASELPPGSYYDCPPDTDPRMLRPCILVTP